MNQFKVVIILKKSKEKSALVSLIKECNELIQLAYIYMKISFINFKQTAFCITQHFGTVFNNLFYFSMFV